MQDFVTERLNSFRDRTVLWGSQEAVELAALQLLEIEQFDHDPVAYRVDPRRAIDEFLRIIGQPVPIHVSHAGEAFGPELHRVCQLVRENLGVCPLR